MQPTAGTNAPECRRCLNLLKEAVEQSDWPMWSDETCLVDLDKAPEPNDLIFISHRWLTTYHPDPDGLKWARIIDWWEDLKSLRKDIEALKSCEIDRTIQRELVQRRSANPLMLHRHRTELAMNSGGWQWIADGVEFADRRHKPNNFEAASKFHRWILDSISSIKNASIWIDSYAWPSPKHRRTCEYRKAGLRVMLPLLHQIVAQSTLIVIDDDESKQHRRGWTMLERATSDLYNPRATPFFPSEDRSNQVEEQLDRLDFKCSTRSDGSAILVGHALARASATLSANNLNYGKYSAPEDPNPLLNEL